MLHILPLPVFRGIQNGVANVLGFERIAESGRSRLSVDRRLDEVSDLMHESMLVTNLQTRYPPLVHVGMITIGDVDGAPSAQAALILVIEELQAVQIMEIPGDGGILAVDFKGI